MNSKQIKKEKKTKALGEFKGWASLSETNHFGNWAKI